jgi:hypothetical protein
MIRKINMQRCQIIFKGEGWDKGDIYGVIMVS